MPDFALKQLESAHKLSSVLRSCWVEALTCSRETEKLGNSNALAAICLEDACQTPRGSVYMVLLLVFQE